jgi:hypothetical protein
VNKAKQFAEVHINLPAAHNTANNDAGKSHD